MHPVSARAFTCGVAFALLGLGLGQRGAAAVPGVGIVTTVAGTVLSPGFSGDGGPATSAQLSGVRDVAVGPDGTLYLSDMANHRVRKVTPNGVISTIAGTGARGFSGDGGPARSAKLNQPHNLALAPGASALVVADAGNARVRRIDLGSGLITTVAGTGVAGYNGDARPAIAAQLNWPAGVSFTATGDLLISEPSGHRVRRVDSRGVISTIAGNGIAGDSGDGGLASSAKVSGPRSAIEAPDASIYVGEETGNRVRRIAPDSTISTVVGTGVSGFSGDGAVATRATISDARDLAIWGGGLFIADRDNGSVRRVDLASQIITTVAGSGVRGWVGSGLPATQTQFGFVRGIDIVGGVLSIAEDNAAVHRVQLAGDATSPSASSQLGVVGSASAPGSTSTPPVATRVGVGSLRRASVLAINVDPDLGRRNYRVVVQRLVNGKWRTWMIRRTVGARERMMLNPPRGKYRVQVPKQFGFGGSLSDVVGLRK